MHRCSAALLAVSLLVLPALLAAGCGSSSDDSNTGKPAGNLDAAPKTVTAAEGDIPSGSVARVGQALITKATFHHWYAITRKTANDGRSAKRRLTQKQLRDQTMSFLINNLWLLGEGKERNLTISDKEKQQLLADAKKQFGSEAAFQKYLRESGQTENDVIFRQQFNVYSQAIQGEVIKDPEAVTDTQVREYYEENRSQFKNKSFGEAEKAARQALAAKNQQADIEEFRKEFIGNWRPQTYCLKAYVVPECGYRVSGA